jgi:hypothetical protein
VIESNGKKLQLQKIISSLFFFSRAAMCSRHYWAPRIKFNLPLLSLSALLNRMLTLSTALA